MLEKSLQGKMIFDVDQMVFNIYWQLFYTAVVYRIHRYFEYQLHSSSVSFSLDYLQPSFFFKYLNLDLNCLPINPKSQLVMFPRSPLINYFFYVIQVSVIYTIRFRCYWFEFFLLEECTSGQHKIFPLLYTHCWYWLT